MYSVAIESGCAEGFVLRFDVVVGEGCVCEYVVAVEAFSYCDEEDRVLCIVFMFAAGKDDG